jgi:hypothetical protein
MGYCLAPDPFWRVRVFALSSRELGELVVPCSRWGFQPSHHEPKGEQNVAGE